MKNKNNKWKQILKDYEDAKVCFDVIEEFVEELIEKNKSLHKTGNDFAEQIQLMADGMSYDDSHNEIFVKSAEDAKCEVEE